MSYLWTKGMSRGPQQNKSLNLTVEDFKAPLTIWHCRGFSFWKMHSSISFNSFSLFKIKMCIITVGVLLTKKLCSHQYRMLTSFSKIYYTAAVLGYILKAYSMIIGVSFSVACSWHRRDAPGRHKEHLVFQIYELNLNDWMMEAAFLDHYGWTAPWTPRSSKRNGILQR